VSRISFLLFLKQYFWAQQNLGEHKKLEGHCLLMLWAWLPLFQTICL